MMPKPSRLVFTTFAFALSACAGAVQETSSDRYSGETALSSGSPPMCFQYRKEARPVVSSYRLWVHFNNTCRFRVSCSMWVDVMDQEYPVSFPAFQAGSVLLDVVPESRHFEIELDCEWDR